MRKSIIKLCCLIVFFTILKTTSIFAQNSYIVGKILSAEKKSSPIAFASVTILGTNKGTVSDSLGKFKLQINSNTDSLVISSIGFKTKTIASPIDKEKSDVTIYLVPETINLSEVIVLPGENPAFAILRRVVENKTKNNPKNIDYYELERYEKTRFDLNHFTEKIKRNILLRPFDFIWEYSDTTSDGVSFLPVLFSETFSRVYYRNYPKATKLHILATQTKGLKGPKIMKFADNMNLETDIYSNFVSILEKDFPSPINDNFRLYYKYVLAGDTIFIKNELPCRKIYFKPQNTSDVAFTGHVYIDTLSWGIVQSDLKFTVRANVNFVRNYYVQQHYSKPDHLHWMLVRTEVLGDFTVVENSSEMTGFYGRKLIVNKNIVIGQPRIDAIYRNSSLPIESDSARNVSEITWKRLRTYGLSSYDQGVLDMSDSLTNNKKFKRLTNATLTLTSGYYPLGLVDIGNIWTFYSYNLYEKSRVKLGLRSGKKVDKHFNFSGYAAYGFGDNLWKYGGHFNWNFGLKNPFHRKHILGLRYQHDLNQAGRSERMIPLDHFLTSLIRTNALKFRILNTTIQVFYERHWMPGFSTRFTAFHNEFNNYGKYSLSTGKEINIFKTTEKYTDAGVQFSFRYAHRNANNSAQFGDGFGGINSVKRPILSVEFTWAKSGILNSHFDYSRLRARLEHRSRLNRLGYTDWMLEGGKIWGNVHWTLLFTPIANQMVLNDKVAFNLMNYLEFLSDQYTTAQIEHHFDGLFLNYIPLVKKLKWREFIFGKVYSGNLSPANKQSSYYPMLYETQAISKPYYELGFGFENIFKIARIDFVWRLDYNGKANTYPFIIKPSFYFKF